MSDAFVIVGILVATIGGIVLGNVCGAIDALRENKRTIENGKE